MNPYQIELSGLRFYGYHGALIEEQRLGQEFLLDLWLEVKGPSQLEDRPEQVVDYGAVSLKLQEVFDQRPHHLLESLGTALLDGLSLFPGILSAKLRIKKISPPIPIPLDFVAVLLTRSYVDVP